MDNKISIIVPCFNQGAYLNECVDSILKQTFTNWECIIVDDGSTDNSFQIANELSQVNQRIRVISQSNKGLCSARNVGIVSASSEFILPLDADDKISPNYLERCLYHFNNNPITKVVYGNANKFGSENVYWDLPKYSYKDLLFGNMIYCTAMFKKVDWENAGGYDLNMTYGYEDWEFWINILDDDSIVIKDDSICFFYRVKNNSMFANMTGVQISLMRQYVYCKHSKKYASFFIDPLSLYKSVQTAEADLKLLLKRPDIYLKKAVKNLFSR